MKLSRGVEAAAAADVVKEVVDMEVMAVDMVEQEEVVDMVVVVVTRPCV
jgi:surfactin synthase thioesterase subunit